MSESMTVDNRFRPVMAQHSDEELHRVMRQRRDYVPEALTACVQELRERGISEAELEALEAEGRAHEAAADALAELPLESREKQLYFLFSFLMFTPLVAFFYRKYAEKGEERRSWESITMVLLGVLFYLALYGVLQRLGWQIW
ncbi:MAG: hypothetical protein AAGN35_28085 [Bacteroidota bacterium]